MALSNEAAKQHNEVKAFQFIEGRPSTKRRNSPFIDDNDKENSAEQVSKPRHEMQRSEEKVPIHVSSQSEQPSSQKAAYPSTPATRMPLADLVGDADENVKGSKATNDVSPEEQISWHAVRSPGGSQLIKTPAKRGQKRARSSSPPSSAANRSKKAKESLDMWNLRKSVEDQSLEKQQ